MDLFNLEVSKYLVKCPAGIRKLRIAIFEEAKSTLLFFYPFNLQGSNKQVAHILILDTDDISHGSIPFLLCQNQFSSSQAT